MRTPRGIRIKHILTVKTVGAFLLMLVLLVAGGLYMLRTLQDLRAHLEAITRVEIPVMQAVTHIASFQLEQHRIIESRVRFGLLYTENPTFGLERLTREFAHYSTLVNNDFEKAGQVLQTDARPIYAEARGNLEALREKHEAFDTQGQKIIDAIYDGQISAANSQMTRVGELSSEIDQSTKGLLLLIQNYTEEQVGAAREQEKSAIRMATSLTLAAVFLGLLFSVVLWKELTMLEDLFEEVKHAPPPS